MTETKCADKTWPGLASHVIAPLETGDGDMDLLEAMMQGWTKAMFDSVDLNGDGTLTKSEFRQYQMRLMGFEDV